MTCQNVYWHPGGHLVRPACSLLPFVINAFHVETVIVPCFKLRSGFKSTFHIVCGLRGHEIAILMVGLRTEMPSEES